MYILPCPGALDLAKGLREVRMDLTWCASASWATCSQSPRLTVSVARPQGPKDSRCLPTGERYRRLELCLSLLLWGSKTSSRVGATTPQSPTSESAGHSLAVKVVVPDQPGAVKQGFVAPMRTKQSTSSGESKCSKL